MNFVYYLYEFTVGNLPLSLLLFLRSRHLKKKPKLLNNITIDQANEEVSGIYKRFY